LFELQLFDRQLSNAKARLPHSRGGPVHSPARSAPNHRAAEARAAATNRAALSARPAIQIRRVQLVRVQMKIPIRCIFSLGPCGLLDVARPYAAKSFNSRHARDTPPVDPIQRTFGYFQRLVQPCTVKFALLKPILPFTGR